MSKLRAQGSLWPSVYHFYTVVGVLPREFEFVSKASDFEARNQFDVWVPLALNLEKLQRNTHFVRVFARLKPGVTLTQAQADLTNSCLRDKDCGESRCAVETARRAVSTQPRVSENSRI